MQEHQISLEELYCRLASGSRGLTTKEAEQRLKTYGPNILVTKRQVSLIGKFLKQFTNFFAILLMAGAMLAFLAEYLAPGDGNLYIGIALFFVVILNATFTFIQEYQSEKIMDSFKKMLPTIVEVLRDGQVQEIKAEYLVPGDIICLDEGDRIPADGRLIEQNVLKVDHSSITGESEPQLRKLECTHPNILESRNMVFSGTLVQTGNGKAIIYGTGMNTEIGKIVRLTKETKDTDTTLHKELKYFIKIISGIAISLGVIFFLVSILLGQHLIGSLIFAIGIIVANVPEGLLPTVTLSLSIAAKKMAKKNALIKNLESVETLGATTVICTDKTGTLTENRMALTTTVLNLEEKNVHEKDLKHSLNLPELLRIMVLCNNAKADKHKFTGDPTETSLLDFAKRHLDIAVLLKKEKRIHEEPFDSKTKRMITINKQGRNIRAYLKGAPEVVITMCSQILIGTKLRKLTPKDKAQLLKFYEKLASRGERVLALAYKGNHCAKIDHKNFIMVGLVGLLDPPRRDVAKAIKKCHKAGIKVIMVTGDYSLTAESIARQVSLIPQGEEAAIVSGEELNKMSDRKLNQILKNKYIIFARENPEQKLRIIKALQSLGEVVTVTGDGVNDAPALKNADMGVAMGISGTEVAREASDMVLLDDHFATIVNAIEEGRTIYDNIKKFIAYILTSNVPEILPFIAFALFNLPLALTVVLILSIDLGSDLLPAIGLGMEKPESDVMKKMPRPRTERLLTKKLLMITYGIVGVFQAAAGFVAFFFVLRNGGWQFGQELATNDPLYLKAVTAFFASIIICQIADVLICRTRRQSLFKVGFFSNKFVVLGIIAEIVILMLIVYFPPTHRFFNTQPLDWYIFFIAVPFALLTILADEFRKYLVRKGNQFVINYLSW